MKLMKYFTALLVVVAAVNAPGLAQTPSSKIRLPKSDQDPVGTAFWDSVYAGKHVLDVQIEITREGWDAMQPPRGRNQRSPYTRATITIDGEQFDNAGLRFKGNSSLRSTGPRLKKPFKIDLNRFTKDQKLHGQTKLNLSNSFLDPAFMKEKLGYELYRAAGLTTPGVGWANLSLTIKGVPDTIPLGIYVLVEQIDRRFLANKFGKSSKHSLLMKPEVADWYDIDNDPKSYQSYNIKSGDENGDQLRAFASLIKLIEHASDTDFENEIGKRMDLNQFAGYLAATSILANVDSYVGMPHNYYLMMDKADGKLRILPWDVNEAFGTFTMHGNAESLVDWDINRPWVGKRHLLERLFASEAFPKLYRAAIEQLLKTSFTADLLFNRIAEFEKVLSPYAAKASNLFWLNGTQLKQKPADHLEAFRMTIEGDEAGLNRAVKRKTLSIKPFVLRRIESIKAQLAGKKAGKKLGR